MTEYELGGGEKMTIEHLGDMATAEDLRAFRLAVSRFTGMTEAEAEEYVWNKGAWTDITDLTVDTCTDCGAWIFEGDEQHTCTKAEA